jgi:tetratricopeptide (TPR) repeat protein
MRAALPLALALLSFLLGACKAPTYNDYVERGDELLKKGDCRGALVQYEQATKVGTPNHRLYQAIARGHLKLGNLDKAIDNYVSAAKLLARDGERVAAQIGMIQDPEKRETLIHLLEDRIKPYSSDVWFQLAMLFKTKEDDAKGVDALRESLHWVQRNLRARMELALLLESKMDYDAALAEWQFFVKFAEKASPAEKLMYRIIDKDIRDARSHIGKLLARQRGTPAEKEE